MSTENTQQGAGSGAHVLYLERLVDAPRQLVWDVWTKPEHMARWWGPYDVVNPSCDIDLRVGGAFRWVMASPEGEIYPMTGVFLEIDPPKRLVYTNNLDEHDMEFHDFVNEKIGQAPGQRGPYPTTYVELVEEAGKTRMKITMDFPSAALREVYSGFGALEGWEMSFVKMDALVVDLRS